MLVFDEHGLYGRPRRLCQDGGLVKRIGTGVRPVETDQYAPQH